MTVWQTIERGEFLMIPLACMLVAIIMFWWIKGVKLSSPRKKNNLLIDRVRDCVTEGDIDNALQISNNYGTPGGAVISAGLQQMGKPISQVSDAMDKTIVIEKIKFERGFGWMKCLAVISPLLGLGGTLIGITDRLRDLGSLGESVDLAMICNEIAPCVVTTVAGLVVGIMALVALTSIEASATKSTRGLEELGRDFIRLLNQPS